MAKAFSFDTAYLEASLKQFGLKSTWRQLLNALTRSKGSGFEYLLDAQFLAKSLPSDVNILEGLSIGQIGVLYEYSAAYSDSASRKDNGQFFTPDDVAELMVHEALDFPQGTWLDPCSGIGNLSWHLVNAQANKEEFLKAKMVLVDQDGLALEIARVLFTISFQDQEPDLYHQIESNFIQFDFLSVAQTGEPNLFSESHLSSIPKHDFVIVNPPYLGLRKEDTRFQTSKAKDLYAYFLENIIKTSRGFVSVTPQSFTNAGKFESLRKLLLDTYPGLKIYSFDNIPGNLFFGVKFGSSNSNSANSIRASITVARDDLRSRSVTSLLRWKTSERTKFFSRIPEFLAEIKLDSTYFPKVSSVFLDLFKEMQTKRTLGELLSKSVTDYVLFVPAAPRYFISALKNSVSRASMKTLYFKSEADQSLAYLLLNSSLMYWWWRVRDGGMTLSLETIRSLPLPDFKTNSTLAEMLLASESSNKVYKMNAGALHENVKHGLDLVAQLNSLIIPEYADLLILTHQNSELCQLPD